MIGVAQWISPHFLSLVSYSDRVSFDANFGCLEYIMIILPTTRELSLILPETPTSQPQHQL